MTNPYYNGGSFPSTGSPATSASMRAELASVSTGFDKLPTLSGNGGKLIAVNPGATALEAATSLSVLSVVDSGFTVVDNADATKKIAFEVSGVTAGTTRTITAPDADLTLVGTATTQTLTNKTLTAPVISTISNSGTLTLPTGSDTLVGRATTDTLTNKTLSADNNTISGIAASSFVLSNASGNLDGSAAQKAIPTGVVVGTTDSQTLTNKTIAFASNTLTGVLAQGATTIFVPAIAMVSRTTSGAAAGSTETATNRVMIRTLDFDAATAEYAQFSVRMPKSWDEGTVTAFFLWSNASGTGNVVWGIQGLARSDDDPLDTAFGTAVTVTDGVTAAGDLMQSTVTGSITIGGTPAESDLVIFQVYRDAASGSDTLATDARLHGVVIIYATNAANDA